MKFGRIIDNQLRFPFQEDDKFRYWFLNKIMRDDSMFHANVYIKNQKDRI